MVSYLNTVPLVWGMLHGEQRELSICTCDSGRMRRPPGDGRADIGIVPAVELNRQKLEIIPGAGIACHGPVRSILLISKVPFGEIRKLATDSTSRTSVALSRIILARKYGVEPQVRSQPPHLASMLERCGRRADYRRRGAGARSRRASVPCAGSRRGVGRDDRASDGVRGLGRARRFAAQDPTPFPASLRFGLDHIDDIARDEHAKLGFSEEAGARISDPQHRF